MTYIEHAAVIRVPLDLVYRHWCAFESFPRFMESVDSVQRLAEDKLLWTGDFFGEYRSWYAAIGMYVPNQLVTWHNLSGPRQNFVIRTGYVSDNTTRVTIQSVFDPKEFALPPATAVTQVSRRLADDLRRFKLFVEAEGADDYFYRTSCAAMP